MADMNNSQLPDRYYGDNFNMEEEIEDLTDEERRKLGKISGNADKGRDRLSLPEKGSRSMISAVLALVLALASLPFAALPWVGMLLALLSAGFTLLFRLKFGFFIRLTVLAIIFSGVGFTVSAFVLILRAIIG